MILINLNAQRILLIIQQSNHALLHKTNRTRIVVAHVDKCRVVQGNQARYSASQYKKLLPRQ